MAAMNRATAAQRMTVWLPSPDSAQPEMAWMLKPLVSRLSRAHGLAAKNRMEVPTSSPTSPTRTVKNALRAARAFGYSSHQWPIRRNEQRPMISQPRISWTMFSARTITSIRAENNVMEAKKWVYRRSPRTYSTE